MAVRSTLATLFADANALALEPAIRSMVQRLLDERPSDDTGERLAAVEAENAKLKKKLDMAMGAIQAGTAQMMSMRREVAEATKIARQAAQAATTATATAETASEGVTELEARLAAAD